MEDILFKALEKLVGGNLGAPAVDPDRSADLANEQEHPAVAWVVSRKMAERMALRGFTRTHTFGVLPSPNRIRWLLPQDSAQVSAAGLQVFAPYVPGERLLKVVLSLIIKTGWQGWARHKVTVGLRQVLPLEALIAKLWGEERPVFALSISTSTRFRKLTVQIMRPSGQILGYIKLPLTQAATERVRHEAEILKRLSEFTPLHPHIPRVLHASEWNGSYALFLSPGPMSRGPMQYNSLHEDFLGRLRNIHQLVRQGRVLLEEVAARWHKADTLLDSNWRALGEAALARAKRELDGRTVQCGVTHGDFVPWNTRVDGGRLFVFDWESASWEAPGGWDEFHFYTQVASLLRNNALHLLLDRWSGQRASFLLYLLSSVCSLLDEDVPAAHAEIMCRQSMLAEQLVS